MDRDEDGVIAARGAAVALEVPPECVAGVAANLAVLAEHVTRIEALPLPGDPAQ